MGQKILETQLRTKTSTQTKVLKAISLAFIGIFVLSWLFVMRLIVSH